MRLLLTRAAGLPPRRSEAITPLGVRRFLSPLLFMSPALVAILLFFLTPAVLMIVVSLTNMSVATGLGGYSFIGLENYRRLALSRWTPLILKNTLFYVVMTQMFNTGLGLLLALLTTHINDRVGTVFRAIWFLPRITPSVVYALLWLWVTAKGSTGVVNQFLGLLGVEPRNWMATEPWLCIILMSGIVGSSFGMVIFTSAIKSIPDVCLIAAKVDGATRLQTIRRIILPLMRWPILFVTAYQTLSLLASFEYILLTTNGGPGLYQTEVWVLHAYHRALSNFFGNAQFGYGAALATVIVVLGIAAAIIYLRVFRFREMMEHEPKIEVN